MTRYVASESPKSSFSVLGSKTVTEDEIFVPNPDYGELTFVESFSMKLIPLYLLSVTIPAILFRRLVSPFISRPLPHLTRDIGITVLREGRSFLNARQSRSIKGPGSHHIKAVLSSPRFSSIQAETLYQRIGTKTWAGDLFVLDTHQNSAGEVRITGDEDVVIYYLHGGAYCVFQPGNFAIFIMRMLEAVMAGLEKTRRGKGSENRGFRIALLGLDYSLAPETPFPGQLIQAESAYRWLVEDMRVPAGVDGKFVVLGDSAGGNLALALFTHFFNHPHPALPPPPPAIPHPTALFLLSPWTTFTDSSPSFKKNAYVDMLHLSVLHYAVDAFRGPHSLKDPHFLYYTEFTHPVSTSETNLPRRLFKNILPKRTWVHAGDSELLIWDIEKFVEAAREEGVEVRYEVVDNGMHDPALVESTLPFREDVGKYLKERVKVERDKVIWGKGVEGLLKAGERVGNEIGSWGVGGYGDILEGW